MRAQLTDELTFDPAQAPLQHLLPALAGDLSNEPVAGGGMAPRSERQTKQGDPFALRGVDPGQQRGPRPEAMQGRQALSPEQACQLETVPESQPPGDVAGRPQGAAGEERSLHNGARNERQGGSRGPNRTEEMREHERQNPASRGWNHALSVAARQRGGGGCSKCYISSL